VYVVSSAEVSAVATIEVYNTIENTWSEFPSPLPDKLNSLSIISHKKKLYIIGGYDTRAAGRVPWCYNLIQDSFKPRWIRSSALLHGRSHHAAISFDNRIWIVGGIIQGENTSTATCEVFDPERNESIPGPNMCRSRYRPRLVVLKSRYSSTPHQGDLYVVGGDILGTSFVHGSIEVLDRATGMWRVVTHFPRRRAKSAVCALDDHNVCLFGGIDGAELLHSSDIFDANEQTWSSREYDEAIAGRRNGLVSAAAVRIAPSLDSKTLQDLL
jgi:N-acetylneuraminic acid mutarotase